jgi:thiol-disulfide isomerase/thioredoxin
MSLCLVTLICDRAEAQIAQTESAQQLPKLIDLGAHKCIPCIKMAPILDELTKEDILKKWQELGYNFDAAPVEKTLSRIRCCTP